MKIWSSISLKTLRKTIEKSNLDSSKIELTNNLRDINSAEILFGKIPKDKLNTNNSIKWIQLESSDTSYIKGIKVPYITNAAGINSRVIAESLLGSLLSFYRGLLWCQESQKEKLWRRWEIRSNLEQLYKKKIIIMGAGKIAKSFINLINPFQCKIIVFRQRNLAIKGCKTITRISKLEKEMLKTDIVINMLPSSPKTENFLSNQRLEIIPQHAILVNVGRGSTLDEISLFEKLTKGKLKAAILDVTQQEPIDKSSPLWEVPNLYLTQHSFAGHHNEIEWLCQFFAKNLKRYLTGENLLNKIKE